MILSFRRLVLPLLAGVVALGVSGCGSSINDAATVRYSLSGKSGTAHVDKAQFQSDLSTLSGNAGWMTQFKQATSISPKTDAVDPRLASIWLTQSVHYALIDAQFDALHLSITDTLRTQAKASLTSGPPFFDAKVFGAFPKSFQTRMIEEQSKLLALEQTCSSGRVLYVIAANTHADAETAFNRIRGGQQFGAVAQALSADPTTGQRGGFIGCLGAGEFIKGLQDVAESVPFDTVTVPVKTDRGYLLVLVRRFDAKSATDPAYASTMSGAAQSTLAAAENNARVWVNPLYGSWRLQPATQNSPATCGVVPASVPSVPTDRNSPTTTSTSLPLCHGKA